MLPKSDSILQFFCRTARHCRVVFGGAATSIYQNWSLFLQTLALPILVLVVLDLYKLTQPTGPQASGLLAQLLYLILYTTIAITTHRVVLLGASSVSTWGIYRWSKRETRFALYAFLLVFIVSVIGIFGFVSSMVNGLGVFITLTLMFVLGGRLCLVFPAIAIDQKMTFKDSWNWTRGHTLSMFVIVCIVPYAILIIGIFIGGLLSSLVPQQFYFPSVFRSLAIVFEISLISHAYQLLVVENHKPSKI